MPISDLTLYIFFKEKLNFSDIDARQCVKELILKEEKSRSELKQNMIEETKQDDCTTKECFEDTEVRIGKNIRELIIAIIFLMLAFATLGIAIIKLS